MTKVEDAIIDNRLRLRTSPIRVQRVRPSKLQRMYIAAINLIKWTIAPTLVGPTPHQPIRRIRIIQHCLCNWNIVLLDFCPLVLGISWLTQNTYQHNTDEPCDFHQ